MSDAGGDDWALSESKDWKDGRHRRENRYVHEHAGQVGESRTRNTLSTLEAVYERAYRKGWITAEWPESARETDLYRTIRTHYETETYAKRVENEPDKLRSHVGSERDEIDVSGWQDIETIRQIVTETHLRLYIYGEPGTGKTRSGTLVARHWLESQQDAGHQDARILTNIRTLAEGRDRITWVRNWPELRDEIDMSMSEILAEDSTPFLFLFDEASSQASGTGSDGYEASTKLATLVYKIRKYGGALAIIGHDGKDLHPAVRELCKVLHKTDKKVARFYETVRNREGRDPITPEITGWPDSKWKPNDKDPAPWNWSRPDNDESDENDGSIAKDAAYRRLAIWTVIQAKTLDSDDPPSNKEVANKHLYGEYSGEWVRQRWNEYQDGQHGDIVAEIQQEIN